MNLSQHLSRPTSPKHLLFFFTLVFFSSLYYIFTSIKTITISSPQDLQEHSISLQKSSKNQSFFYFPLCPNNFTNYLPCHDPPTSRKYIIERERHCPDSNEKVKCLVPKPLGYKTPFTWPDSITYAWFKNVPFEFKETQNSVRLEGNRFVFPGGVKDYVDMILEVLPLASGSIRTVLDIGCGVASFGAFLLNYNILTMSIAPRDIDEAQVQFALERGLPAMLGVLSTYKLPYPSSSFEVVHCSRCLVNWTAYDGLYLMEVDRVLRPNGYWILSGPPITSSMVKIKNKEMKKLNNVFRRLCWEKIVENYPDVVIWRKPSNHFQCRKRLKEKALKFPKFCSSSDHDAAWYKEMEPCISPIPEVTVMKNWPDRLNHAPARIKTGLVHGMNISTFIVDTNLWRRIVVYYDTKLKFLTNGKYRNVMDMNAGIGGFAAALNKDKYSPVWVMNVVPSDLKPDTLGVVFDRGLIGTYMNWCEAFSTYPRTYDLIHANGVFSLYLDKCDIVDILLEMQRILRPEGAVIIRDRYDVLIKVKNITNQMRWNGTIYPVENNDTTILIVNNSVM